LLWPRKRGAGGPDLSVIRPSATSCEAARPIPNLNVGSLRAGGENGQLIGMVTDRDIVVGAVPEDALPSATAVRGSALPPISCLERPWLSFAKGMTGAKASVN
jgi:CBS domain-containing protein